MSHEIATHYHQTYARGIELLAQQMNSETDGAVREEDMAGKREFFDQVGKVRMIQKTGNAVDIPVVNTPHARRAVTAKDFIIRDFIDEMEKLKVLNDPTNAYSETFAAAGFRERDKVTIDAALGTSFTGEEGATAVVLPASQKIPDGGAGFTFAKLRQAVRIIKSRNALMRGDTLHVWWTAKQEEEFINTTEVKSSDFNNTKVLVDGELRAFYKCNFRRIEDVEDDDANRMLPLAGGVRSCILWVKSGVLRATRQSLTGRVSYIDERDSFQVMAKLSVGATRMQETKVVQIDVAES